VLCNGCGYRFTGGAVDNPYPREIKTIVIESVINSTTIRGLETELTNRLRREFALANRLTPVRSEGDLVLATEITAYEETAAAFDAKGKEITRNGVLRVSLRLKKSETGDILWRQRFSASSTYNVASSITDTLTNQRQALSRMIEEIAPDIHRAMYEQF
jgi:TolB-like protein